MNIYLGSAGICKDLKDFQGPLVNTIEQLQQRWVSNKSECDGNRTMNKAIQVIKQIYLDITFVKNQDDVIEHIPNNFHIRFYVNSGKFWVKTIDASQRAG